MGRAMVQKSPANRYRIRSLLKTQSSYIMIMRIFQQTNAISGEIGVGTGGVTEALRNRVVFPFAMD
jgi:hypothetical protein